MPPSGIVQRAADAALAQLHLVETIERAYEAWLELKIQHAAFRARAAEERRKIDQQGSFLVGAVRAAAQVDAGAESSLLRSGGDPLDAFLGEAEQKLSGARAALEASVGEQEALFAGAFEEIRDEALRRVRRTLEKTRPLLRLRLRTIGQDRMLLHVDRVGPDEAVLLLFVTTGRIPSRYGYLFDDSTDDVALPPPPLYPDEEVVDVRPGPESLRRWLGPAHAVLPVKGWVPVSVPVPTGGEAFFRMLQRGPVMEVELQDGDRFRNLLSRDEGERFAGHLLRLKLQGRIELDVLAD